MLMHWLHFPNSLSWIEGHKYGIRILECEQIIIDSTLKFTVILKVILTAGTSQHADTCCQPSAVTKVVTGAHDLSCLKLLFSG
jgi:hypothetical protein